MEFAFQTMKRKSISIITFEMFDALNPKSYFQNSQTGENEQTFNTIFTYHVQQKKL